MFYLIIILIIISVLSVLPGIGLLTYGYVTHNKNLKLAGIVVAVLGFQVVVIYGFFIIIGIIAESSDYYY